MLAGVDSLWALLPLMTLLGFGVAVSQPAEFALVPAAAGPDIDAARANGLMETARSIGFTAGPLVGGALGAAGLLWLALALNALSFVVVAAAAAAAARAPSAGAAPRTHRRRGARPRRIRLPRARARPRDHPRRCRRRARVVLDVRDGRAVLRHRRARGGSLAYGVLLTSWTLGMAAGSAGLAHRVGRAQLAAGGLVAVVLQGFGIAGGALSTVLWMALIGFSFGGVAHGVKNVLLRTLIHERAPEALRGRVFAAYNGARNGAELGALVLGGDRRRRARRPRGTARSRGSDPPRSAPPACCFSSTPPPRRGGGHHQRRESSPCTCPRMSWNRWSSASTRAARSTPARCASRSSRCRRSSRPTSRRSKGSPTIAASATTGATCSRARSASPTLDGPEEVVRAGEAYHLRPGHFVQTLEPVELIELSPVEEHDRTMATIARNMGLVAS